MLLIELNEFSPTFLKQASAHLDTPTLDALLGWSHSRTETSDKQERFGLDPWVQWVSIHTGRPSREHGISHLAEASKLQYPQIWDALNERGFTTTVWGPMNGKNNRHANMKTFFPDPWTFSESPSPHQLRHLLALPRFYAQNYIQPHLFTLLGKSLQTACFLLLRHPLIVLGNMHRWLAPLCRGQLNNAILFALFDNLTAKLFVEQCESDQSEFKLVFLNSIAHLQHHNWRPDCAEVTTAVRLLEDTLKTVLSAAGEGEPVMLVNAFSQESSAERNEYLYRPIDPASFIRHANIPFSRVEQMMTNDGHIFFDSAEQCDTAYNILKAASIDGQSAFDVDRRGEKQLFYQFIIWRDLQENTRLQINDLELNFYGEFEKVVQRTGAHIAEGDIFYRNIELPRTLENHTIYDIIQASYVPG